MTPRLPPNSVFCANTHQLVQATLVGYQLYCPCGDPIQPVVFYPPRYQQEPGIIKPWAVRKQKPK